jgi:cytochrome b
MKNKMEKILVWDLPVRFFHWSLALSFAVAYLSSESERWQLVHITSGYVLVALIVFRLIWGFTGSRYARFSEFVRGPGAIKDYLLGLLRLRPPHYTGHNPAGAVAVLALLSLGLVTAASGWANFNEIGGVLANKLLEELHEGAASIMLTVVGIHVAAVLLTSLLHRENLVASMIHGFKQGRANLGISRPYWGVALAVLALIGGTIFIAAR